jgi:NADPH-dependent 2,4-dienoyl-CoA reductase/sulfur reductase-like enzyme
LILSKESVLPYDRTMLTKSVNADTYLIRNSEFLDEYGIDYYLNHEVGSIEPANKAVRMKDGYRINYDKLLIATGGKARIPTNEGINLKNIFTLRNSND